MKSPPFHVRYVGKHIVAGTGKKGKKERKKAMSEIERTIAKELAKLPEAVQDKFLLMAQGAAVAVECAIEAAETGDDLSTTSRSPSPEGEAEDGGAA